MMINTNPCVNVLHVEDDVEKVHNYVCAIYGKNGNNLKIMEAEDIRDNLKKEGDPLEIVPGYWWAENLKEAVWAIDKMNAEGRVFDFVLIDRKLSDAEQTSSEKFDNQTEIDNNKNFLKMHFPWYNQESYTYTGDFLFLYLTIINKAYLRNIFFVSGQPFNKQVPIEGQRNSDVGLIKIWYKISGDEFVEGQEHSEFDEWFRTHYIKKGDTNGSARKQLIGSISLPNAGICNQFHEALDIFKYHYVDDNSPVIHPKYREAVIKLLIVSKQYNGTEIDKKDLADLREGLNTLARIIAKKIFGSDVEYVNTYRDRMGKEHQKTYTFADDNNNINPYEVKKALLECRKICKHAERLGYLISFVYHIQSQEVHGDNFDASKVLNNTYTMHTTVFAFMEICRYIVQEILKQNPNIYKKQ